MRILWLRTANERGTVLVLALFIMAFLLVAGAFLLRMSSAETDIAYNTVWAEGSFFAAEAGLNVAVDLIGPLAVGTSTVANTALDNQYSYSGNATFIGTSTQPGYSLGAGTGYNPAGYVFFTHTVTGTGTGPRSAQRQIQARTIWGPVAQ
jgi:hypothetical protein